MTAGYLDALAARSAAVGSVLCVGIDPTPDALPDGFPAGLAGVERFARLIVEDGRAAGVRLGRAVRDGRGVRAAHLLPLPVPAGGLAGGQGGLSAKLGVLCLRDGLEQRKNVDRLGQRH